MSLYASPWHDGAWYRQQLGLLADAAAATGGRVVPVRRPEEIAPAFAEIVRELREQYVLGYYPEAGCATTARGGRSP